MKTRSIALLAAALACCAACSRKPETPTAAGSPTPAPAATPAPTPAGPPRVVYTGSMHGFDPKDDTVLAFDMTGAPLAGFKPINDIDQPKGLAVDPASHTLFVIAGASNEVRSFDAATGAPKPVRLTTDNGLTFPGSLAVENGTLYLPNGMSNNVLAFDAATGKPVTAGFRSPPGLSHPSAVAVRGGTLYVDDTKFSGNTTLVGAYDLATGAPVAGFTPIKLGDHTFSLPLAVSGGVLFIYDTTTNKLAEYDAVTGAVLNADFPLGFQGGEGLALLGRSLFVGNSTDSTVGRVELPDKPTAGNAPASSNPRLIPKLNKSVVALAVSP